MHPDFYKLDNPAWHALTETHACFSEGNNDLKRYDPDIVLFAGLNSKNKNLALQFDEVINPEESFFLIDNLPVFPENYLVESAVECLQMVCTSTPDIKTTESIIRLDETNTDAMYSLVSEVFPGYYQPQTRRLGDYYGIFKEGRLAAMAGERLCMEGFTEISAVVTHPEFTGRKFSQQLVSFLNHKNIIAGSIPFLHTGVNNERAIYIYELLGYKKRRLIPVTKIKRIGKTGLPIN